MFSLYVGYVLSTKDDYHAERIKAVIPPDKGSSGADIPYAFPLLPKMLHVKPKEGEAVLVLVANDKEANGQRYYIGPIISQPHKMEGEDFMSLSPTKFLGGGIMPPDASVDNYGDSYGALPEDSDVAVLGRKNTDIILTDNDVRMRAGVRLTKGDEGENGKVEFNRDAPAYIKLKHHEPILKTEQQEGEINPHLETRSTATIVADKINLIAQNGDEAFKLNDKEEGIDDEAMAKILEKAHKLPYGDVLCDFFSLFLKMYMAHVHPYPGMQPIVADPDSVAFLTKYGTDKNVLEDKLLSKDIRIN